MPKTHDQIMKELLSEFAEQFLSLVAPELAAQLDFSAIELEPAEYYDDNAASRERRPDLLARLAAKDQDDKVLVNVEIVLKYLQTVPPKLLDYNRGLRLKSGLVVHTIVLYLHGGPPGIQERVYEEKSLGRVVNAFYYFGWGLSRTPSAEFLGRAEPLAWALAALMRPAKDQSRGELGVDCLRRIFGAPDLDGDQRAQLAEVVLTYCGQDGRALREIERLLAAEKNEEVRVMITTWSEKMEARGVAKGEAQGMAKGERKATLELAFRLLAQRFGELSEDVRQRIAAIESTEKLAQLVERVFRGDSLEDLGLA